MDNSKRHRVWSSGQSVTFLLAWQLPFETCLEVWPNLLSGPGIASWSWAWIRRTNCWGGGHLESVICAQVALPVSEVCPNMSIRFPTWISFFNRIHVEAHVSAVVRTGAFFSSKRFATSSYATVTWFIWGYFQITLIGHSVTDHKSTGSHLCVNAGHRAQSSLSACYPVSTI